VTDRSHLSIGEVLSLLQEDFPDVTISKIRFLESQGLLDPERTPSGYRKFYESDIERLRWILRQQRENFLPLKVIKDRLASGEVDFTQDLMADDTGPSHDSDTSDETASADASRASAASGQHTAPPADVAAITGVAPASGATPSSVSPAAPAADTSRHVEPMAGRRTTSTAASAGSAAALLQEAPTPRARSGQPPTRDDAVRSDAGSKPPLFDTGVSAISMTLDELMGATGLTAREIGELERFGMLTSRTLGSTTYYDEDALLVARLAAGFRSHGVEARHLRMYKVAAEREAGVFEQLLMPLARKRSPQGRRESAELVNELASLGDGLRTAMLRHLLRDYLEGL